jgi:hypothetical protein
MTLGKTPLQHDQLSGVDEDQHHSKKHDLSSDNHTGKLDESKIIYRNPPLHTHKFDAVTSGKIKVKKQGSAETKAHSLIEFRGDSVSITENTQFDRIIVDIGTSIITVPAGTPEHYVLSSYGSPSDSTGIWREPYIRQSLTGTLIGTRPEINLLPIGSYLTISAVDDPVNNRVNFYLESIGNSPSSTVTSETSFGQAANAGSATTYSKGDHTHGTPANPVTAHEITYNHALLHSNANDPTSDQKAALAGTSGTPSSTNKYVTNDDSRNTNQRTPTSHDSSYHTVTYEVQSNKGVAGGYCGLDGSTLVAESKMGTGTGTSSKFLRGDRFWTTVTWANVDKGTSNISDITTRSHTSLSDIGSNTHSTIDSHLSNTTTAHDCTSSATASKIIIRDAAGRAEVEGPTSTKEIATKGYCDGLSHLPAGSTNAVLYYDGSWKALAAPDPSQDFHLGCMKGNMTWDAV